jgi:hypothetical protein
MHDEKYIKYKAEQRLNNNKSPSAIPTVVAGIPIGSLGIPVYIHRNK